MPNYIFNKPINKIIHGGDYNPEQWLDCPDILAKDIEFMKAAGINEATLGVFSWAMYEPAEGELHFDWLKEIMDNLYKTESIQFLQPHLVPVLPGLMKNIQKLCGLMAWEFVTATVSDTIIV